MIFTMSDKLRQEFAKIYKELYKEEDDEKVDEDNFEIHGEALSYLCREIENIRKKAAKGCNPKYKHLFMDCMLDEITKDEFWIAADMLTDRDNFNFMWRVKFNCLKDKGNLERDIITKNYFKIEEKILNKKMAFYVKCFFFFKYFKGGFGNNPSIDPLGFCAQVVCDVVGCRTFLEIELLANHDEAKEFYSNAAYFHKFDYKMIIEKNGEKK